MDLSTAPFGALEAAFICSLRQDNVHHSGKRKVIACFRVQVAFRSWRYQAVGTRGVVVIADIPQPMHALSPFS